MAAYAACRPDFPVGPLSGLSGPAGATLNLVTIRAQRPLHLTAGRFVNITLSLYLEVSRRHHEPSAHPARPARPTLETASVPDHATDTVHLLLPAQAGLMGLRGKTTPGHTHSGK